MFDLESELKKIRKDKKDFTDEDIQSFLNGFNDDPKEKWSCFKYL